MFNLGDDRLAFFGAGQQCAVDRRVIAFGAAAGENYFSVFTELFINIVGPDQPGNLGSRLFYMCRDLAAETIDTGRVALFFRQKRQHCLEYLRIDRGSGVIVKIYYFTFTHDSLRFRFKHFRQSVPWRQTRATCPEQRVSG